MKPLKKATLCYLVQNKKVLLALKKRGFGQGKWNGIGGKLKGRESPKLAAQRETKEEIGIKSISLNEVAILRFYHLDNALEDMQVYVFVSKQWDGKPQESEEVKPAWFEYDKIPFNSMWPDDQYWLPKILSNDSFFEADFYFKKGDNLIKSIFKKSRKG